MTAPGTAWNDGPWRRLPTLTTDVSTDVCVIGLGGSGLAAIQAILELGQSAIGIDSVDVGAGAAGRNGGLLLCGGAPFHHDAVAMWGRDRAVGIYRATIAEMDRIEQQLPDEVRRAGSLRIAMDPAELEDCERHYAAMCADNLSAERYRGPEGDGLLFPLDGFFQPLTASRKAAERVMRHGAQLYGETPATSIEHHRVVTPQGVIHCGLVIVAVDGNLEFLLPELSPAVRTARLQMLATAPTAEVSLSRPIYYRYGYDYWYQRPDGSVILGGLRDQGGEPEWTGVAVTSAAVQAGLDHLLRDRIGVKRARITHRWAGTVGYTQDKLPVVAEVRHGVWVIGGYSGTGNLIGRILGRGVAEWALTGADATIRDFRP